MKKLLNVLICTYLISVNIGCDQTLDPATSGLLVPKTVDQDSSLPSISVNGTKLHAETFGNPSDPMLVILHGGPGMDYRSMLNCKELADDGYFVVFYDQRGSGLSQRHSHNEYSLQLMYDDLSAVITHYRSSTGQKIFLFGHSWGAMLATSYINSFPHAISGVILAEPGGFTYADMKKYVARLRQFKLDEATNDALYVDQFLGGSQKNQELLDYKFALVSAHSSAPGNAEGIEGPTPFWRLGYVVQESLFESAKQTGFDWTTNLDAYPTEVLFLYSELNSAYGKEYAEYVSSAYPNATVKGIPGTGHEMVQFGWADTYPLVLEYLNSHK